MFSPTETQLASTGAMLRGMREAVGLSLVQLAELAEVSRSTVSRFERGERTVSAEILARITRVIADHITDKRSAA